MNYIVSLPETHVLHGDSNKASRNLQACRCMCVCVPRLLGITLRDQALMKWTPLLHFQELLSTGWDSILRMIHRNHFPNSRMALTWYMICCFAVGKPGSDDSWKRFFPLCLLCWVHFSDSVIFYLASLRILPLAAFQVAIKFTFCFNFKMPAFGRSVARGGKRKKKSKK